MSLSWGELAALLSALLWALGVVLIKKGERGSATLRNFCRHILATLFFGVVLLVSCRNWSSPDVTSWLLLAVSSLMGVVFAETLFLKALELIGAGRTTLIGTLYTPTVVVLSILFLAESISLFEVVGGILIVTATLIVLQKGKGHFTGIGVALALLSVLFNAVGTVTLKPLVETLPILEITFLRLLLSLLPLYLLSRIRNGCILRDLIGNFRASTGGLTIAGTLLADGAAALLWMLSIREGSVLMTTLLGQMAPIFALLFSTVLLKEILPRFALWAMVLSALGGTVIILS